MRTILSYAALALLLSVNAPTRAADPPAKSAINSETVINMCGGRLAKMFATFGTPEDAWADRGTSEAHDDVFFDYGPYAFKVREKIVRVCFFFSPWSEPVRGMKIGDTPEQVIKALGKPSITVKNKEGEITAYGYEWKDIDARAFANFRDGKIWRVEVSIK
jgi:hypothetical protein